jgi:hypothetical protein
VRVSNPTEFTLLALRVTVRGLAEGVQVHNASGDLDGVPFVKYNQAVAPGEAAELVIEYYVSNRRTPVAQLCAQPASVSSPTQQDGITVTMRGPMRLANGSALIEFQAVPGRVYYVQYSHDLRNWKTVTPGVSSGANRIQWIDNGPPKTESYPSDRSVRFYRVITLP